MNPFRGWEYYFTAPGLLSGTKGVGEDVDFQVKRRRFEDVAVSGEDMHAWAKVSWVSLSDVCWAGNNYLF